MVSNQSSIFHVCISYMVCGKLQLPIAFFQQLLSSNTNSFPFKPILVSEPKSEVPTLIIGRKLWVVIKGTRFRIYGA